MTDPDLHILFVAGCWYPVEEDPTSGIFIRRHAEAVARSNRVTVFHPRPVGLGAGPQVTWSESGNFSELVLRYPVSGNGAVARQRDAWRAGRSGLAEVLGRSGPPDIVHFHVVPSAGLALGLIRALPGIPIVLTEHWSGYLAESDVRLRPLRRMYTRWLTRRAVAVTTVSDYLRRAMVDRGFEGRFRVIPNVVDPDVFTARGARRPGPCRIAFVGLLRAEKRVPDIVRTFTRLDESGVAAELHIVGDGPERAAAEAEAGRVASEGRLSVTFHGLLEGAGVAERLADSDALVMFSDFENSPCVIGEAFACGCPVIATRVGGIPEHVTDERGLLVEVGDESGLLRAMTDVAAGRRTFDPERLRRYAVANFSPEVVGRRFAEVYREGCARG